MIRLIQLMGGTYVKNIDSVYRRTVNLKLVPDIANVGFSHEIPIATLLDTGAELTCFSATSLGLTKYMDKCIENTENYLTVRGIDGESESIRAYRVIMSRLNICSTNADSDSKNITIPDVGVYASFDRRYHDNILGMDILHLFDFMYLSSQFSVEITESANYQMLMDVHKHIDKNVFNIPKSLTKEKLNKYREILTNHKTPTHIIPTKTISPITFGK